jgi:hypothetical protein
MVFRVIVYSGLVAVAHAFASTPTKGGGGGGGEAQQHGFNELVAAGKSLGCPGLHDVEDYEAKLYLSFLQNDKDGDGRYSPDELAAHEADVSRDDIAKLRLCLASQSGRRLQTTVSPAATVVTGVGCSSVGNGMPSITTANPQDEAAFISAGLAPVDLFTCSSCPYALSTEIPPSDWGPLLTALGESSSTVATFEAACTPYCNVCSACHIGTNTLFSVTDKDGPFFGQLPPPVPDTKVKCFGSGDPAPTPTPVAPAPSGYCVCGSHPLYTTKEEAGDSPVCMTYFGTANWMPLSGTLHTPSTTYSCPPEYSDNTPQGADCNDSSATTPDVCPKD